ncbi:MAG: iron ABC transporter permease [Candidatus Manganitrophus sp.]|nr:MAG: iron ABC transporter permease [Candidatus Manganitrophus sp.]
MMKPYVLKVPFERGVSFFQRAFLDRWQAATLFIAGLVLIPLAVVLFSVFSETNEVWLHFVQTSLVTLLINTFWLLLGVGVGTAFLGVSLAWLTAACDFPGRKWLDWALMLPLSLPPYVVAFVSIGLLDFTGPIQTQLRLWLGVERLWFPKIRSTGGVIAVMTLTLYPYVYMLARNAFLTQGRRAIEAAQSLGQGRFRGFLRVALPMARPWIVGGLALVLMETLADFGTVSIFNYDTFTTAIYKAWFGLFSLSAAAQLASLLVLIVFVVLLVEQRSRARRRFSHAGRSSVADRILLRGGRGLVGLCLCNIGPGDRFYHSGRSALRLGFRCISARFRSPVSFLFRPFRFFGGSRGPAHLRRSVDSRLRKSLEERFYDADRCPGGDPRLCPPRIGACGRGIFIPLIWIDKQMIGWIQIFSE